MTATLERWLMSDSTKRKVTVEQPEVCRLMQEGSLEFCWDKSLNVISASNEFFTKDLVRLYTDGMTEEQKDELGKAILAVLNGTLPENPFPSDPPPA